MPDLLSDKAHPVRGRGTLIGDIELGRPNQGQSTRLEVYRLMQFSFRDILEKRYGADEADKIFYESGFLAGSEFYANLIAPQTELNEFVKKLQSVLKELGVGILRVEEADMENGKLTLTVSEDLDCSGLPETVSGCCTQSNIRESPERPCTESELNI